jgi:hypothetical protein
VTCLNVEDNPLGAIGVQGVVGGVVTQGKADPTREGQGFLFVIQDGGQGDAASLVGFTLAPPQQCPRPPPPLPLWRSSGQLHRSRRNAVTVRRGERRQGRGC